MNKKLYLLTLISLFFLSERTFAQCVPTVGVTGATGDFVNNFTFNTLSNLGSGDFSGDYQLYPQTTTVIQGQTYPFTIAPGGNIFQQGLAIWIDFNGNNLFTDPGEFVWNTATAVLGPSAQSGNITIPLTAVPGIRRMRIVAKYAGAVVSSESCSIATFGEYEDYNITINANTPCSGNPTAGTATASPANPCPGVFVNFGLTGNSLVGGLTYQWLSSTTNASPWTVIAGANTINYSVQPPTGVTTYYRCIVTCSFSSGFDTSASVPVTVQSWSPTSPCYCISAATNTLYEEILNVTMGTLNNTTTCATPLTGTQGVGTGSANQYTNFTASVPAPVVYIGLAQPFNVTVGHCGGFSLGSAVKVYIDYNHNSVFSDPGEEVYFSGLTQINSIPDAILSGTFTPPGTALPGITRMRVINQVDGYLSATTITPCNSYFYGETEDYLINLIPPSPHDPAVISMTTPAGNCYTANQVITVQVRNYGSQIIDLSVNPIQLTLNVTGPSGVVPYTINLGNGIGILQPYGGSAVTGIFTGVNMYAGGTYSLNTSLTISGVTNGNLINDSLQNPIIKINFRPTPGAPYQLCQFSPIPFGQGLTVSGCATPIEDSVTITFEIQPTTNPTSTAPTGSALFAKAALPALPLGSTIGICEYKVTNLATTAGGWANETRFPLFYGGMPVQAPNVFYPSLVGNPATGSANYTWLNNTPALQNAVGVIYGTLNAGDTLKMGYHSTWGGNSTTNGYTLNAGANPSVATLKIRYTYVPASFEWYSTPTGGINLYSFSPFNPLITTGSGLSNSNTPNTYTWFAACSGSSNCRIPVNLVINPVPQVVQDTLAICESSAGSNSAIFDLTSMDGSVSAFAPNVTVQYFGDQGLFTPVATPTNDTTSTNFKYSKVSLPTGCFSTDSLLLQVNFQPELPTSVITGFACAPASIDVTGLINPLSTSPVGTDTLYYEDNTFTTFHPNPTNISTMDTVYIVFATNTSPVCSDTAVAYIDILPAGSLISAQAGTFPVYYSNAGNYGCTSVSFTDGMSDTIRSSADCRRIAAVTDINNSISLGSVSACQDIAASTPYHNGQPYVNRAYQITAANSDTAMVCLYYLDQDFQDYNADAGFSGWPLLPVSGGPANLSNIAVTKVDNGDLNTPGHTAIAIPNSAINASYDPSSTVWTICFPVGGFSYFYLHTQNPVNAPLPVTMLSFTGKSVDGTSQLNWVTATEQNNSHFVVERSKDGRAFSTLSNAIASKANNGTSETPLNYGYTDATPFQGHNYYRLQQHDIDGKTSFSNVVDVYFGNETMVTLYPNPVNSIMNVDINTPKATSATMKVTDATGRVVKVVSMQLSAGANTTQVDLQGIADGMYMVHITNGKGLDYAQPVRKN
jgi:hypothetical protein